MARPKDEYQRGCTVCRSTLPRHERGGDHHSRGMCRKHYDEWKATKPLCKQGGCTVRIGLKAHDSRQGYCRLHDHLLLGEPHRKPEAIELTLNKFASQIAPRQTNERGCWLWEGRDNGKGYGVIGLGNHDWLAHRYSYGSFIGGHKPQLTLDHVCRVRNCVRPDHMMPMTRRRNTELEHKDTVDNLEIILADLLRIPDMEPRTLVWAMFKGLAVGRAQPGEPFGFGLDGQPFDHRPGPATYPLAKDLLRPLTVRDVKPEEVP